MMKVLILRAVSGARDVDIVMVAQTTVMNMISPVVTIKDAACCIDGNPYLVYGDAVAKFTGRPALECIITCAEFVSGSLWDWVGGFDYNVCCDEYGEGVNKLHHPDCGNRTHDASYVVPDDCAGG